MWIVSADVDIELNGKRDQHWKKKQKYEHQTQTFPWDQILCRCSWQDEHSVYEQISDQDNWKSKAKRWSQKYIWVFVWRRPVFLKYEGKKDVKYLSSFWMWTLRQLQPVGPLYITNYYDFLHHHNQFNQITINLVK